MAHYGFVSPDHRNVLVVEMGAAGGFQRCRLVPIDGSSAGRQVGPDGACTSAGWSPDGGSMFFTASVKGASHLWRQRLADGELEQITSGPAEESGVAISPDGGSIFTSVGSIESGVWMHTATGDHVVQSEGYASRVSFSRDGRFLFYLLKRSSDAPDHELWATDLAAGHSEPVVQGFPIARYDVSSDGKLVVFETQPSHGASQLWVTSRERTFGPRMLASSGENNPYFGAGSTIVFRMSEGGKNYLFKMNSDGSERAKVVAGPIIGLKGVSPDGRWAVAILAVNEVLSTAVFAVPLQGGAARRICPANCLVKWSPDGGRFYVKPLLQGTTSGMAVAVPVTRGASIPDLPTTGIRSADDASLLPGSMVIDVSPIDPNPNDTTIAPGPDPETFAYTRTVSHRNLFRIQLP
jgi:WD40 repeat protein